MKKLLSKMQSVITALVLLSAISIAQSKVFLGDVPLQNPDLFGGDMLGIEHPLDRSAIVGKDRLWPDATVVYQLDPEFKKFKYNSLFYATFYYLSKSTCLKFVERTDQKDYIRVFKGQGCYSHVGKTGGAQPLSLGEGCHWSSTSIHEFVHAIGFYHEQNRSDRDDYLIIYWDNIKEGLADQFFKLKPHQNILINEFDYHSIMLYGEFTFSKDRKNLKTMVAKKPGVKLFEVVSKSLSKSDIFRINTLYCKK